MSAEHVERGADPDRAYPDCSRMACGVAVIKTLLGAWLVFTLGPPLLVIWAAFVWLCGRPKAEPRPAPEPAAPEKPDILDELFGEK